MLAALVGGATAGCTGGTAGCTAGGGTAGWADGMLEARTDGPADRAAEGPADRAAGGWAGAGVKDGDGLRSPDRNTDPSAPSAACTAWSVPGESPFAGRANQLLAACL